MIDAYRLIKKGGMSNLDDIKISGGVRLAIAGSPDMVVGNQASLTIRDKILEWGAFREVYNDIDKLDDAGTETMCKIVRTVLDSHHCMGADDTLEILRETYQLPEKKMCQMFLKKFDFSNSVKIALRTIFSIWVKHLENLIKMYSDLRNNYIIKNPHAGNINDIKILMKKWKAIDKYYGIHTSSFLLLYTNFPQIPYDLPWLRGKFTEDDTWDIHPATFEWNISGIPIIKTLEDELKKFVYLGFCPKRPKYRMTKLFEFPVVQLYDAIEALGGRIFPEKYEEVATMIANIKVPKPDFIIPSIVKEPEPDKADTRKKIKWYVEKILEIYISLKPYFVQVEEYYIKIATKLSAVGFQMTEII